MSKNDQFEWEFPCSLPIKIMGPAKDTLKPLAIQIIQNHAPDFCGTKITATESKTGKYISLTATVELHSKPQLDALFEELGHHQQNGDDISFVI